MAGLGSTWGVLVSGGTAFVTALEGQFATVDVSDSTRPKLLGKIVTGGVSRGLAVDGKAAYVAAGSEGLVVVDASELTSPN